MSNDEDPDRWARLRFAIIGPLLGRPHPNQTSYIRRLANSPRSNGGIRSTEPLCSSAPPQWNADITRLAKRRIR